MSKAISFYLTQVTLHKGILFELKIPNTLTADPLNRSEAGKELHSVNNIDELFEELDDWKYPTQFNSIQKGLQTNPKTKKKQNTGKLKAVIQK